MSNYSRPKVVSGGSSAERWSMPSVDGPVMSARRQPEEESKRTQVEREQTEANRAKGYEEGLAMAQAEVDARLAQLESRVQRLDAILQLLHKPLEQLDDEIERQLTALALAVGKHLARRELRAEPAQIIAIIREAVTRLPAAARDVRVHLHPDDAAIVRERLSTPGNERAWSVVEDPALSQGGCLVRTENSQIDQRFERRMDAIVGSILGDDRAVARTPAETP
jgi:flagellar assembly protein FliH